MQCLGSDGTVKWESKVKFDKGSFVIADGVIFAVEGGNGTVHMIEANPAEYKELGSAKILSGDTVWGPQVISDGRLLLRDQKELKCVDATGK